MIRSYLLYLFIVWLFIVCFIIYVVVVVVVAHSLSWKSFLLLHESTLSLLESAAVASFAADMQEQEQAMSRQMMSLGGGSDMAFFLQHVSGSVSE